MTPFGRGELPQWDPYGLLPASWRDGQGNPSRSPYRASLPEIAARLGNTAPRRNLLRGLLHYRAALRGIGIIRGFQWLNGSMVENVEQRENRSPADLDLVTFLYIPYESTYQILASEYLPLFNPESVKHRYQLDHSFVPLNDGPTEAVIDVAVGWATLFSFTRDGSPKGFVRIDLVDHDEANVLVQLENSIDYGDAI